MIRKTHQITWWGEHWLKRMEKKIWLKSDRLMHNSSQSDHIRRWSKNRRSFSRKVHISAALWWLVSCAMKIPTLSFCYDPLKLTVRVRVHTKLVINWVSNSGFDLCSHMKGAGLSYLEAFRRSRDFSSTENNPYECQPSRDAIRQWFQIFS